jgi:hypothetical protein
MRNNPQRTESLSTFQITLCSSSFLLPTMQKSTWTIDDDDDDASSDDMEFGNTPLLAPIVDDKHLGQSGQGPRTPSHLRMTSHVTSDVASDVASDASSDADEHVNSVQRMHIDAPHVRIPTTLCERETDLTVDDPTTSSSAISADPATKVPEPCSKIDQPTPPPVRFSARLVKKRGRTSSTIDSQPSVHTITAADPVDANPDPANIEDALSHWDHAR